MRFFAVMECSRVRHGGSREPRDELENLDPVLESHEPLNHNTADLRKSGQVVCTLQRMSIPAGFSAA